MSEASNQILAVPSENVESEEAQSIIVDEVLQIQPTDSEESKKIIEEKTADTNTPAIIGGSSTAESATEAIGTPCTGKPAESGGNSNEESVIGLLESTCTVITDEAEEPLECNTEVPALVAPDVIPETDGETMDNEGKDQESIAPNERSNDAPEDSLESIPMDTEESPIIQEGKELEIDFKERSWEAPEDASDSTPMQTDELAHVHEGIQLDADSVESLPQLENDKCTVGVTVSENLLKDNCNIQTTVELQHKDNMEIGKEPVGSNRTLEEVVSLDLSNEDTDAEDITDESINKPDESLSKPEASLNIAEESLNKPEESLNKPEEGEESSALTSISGQHIEEDVDKPSDILEKLSLSPTAKEIDQNKETLNETLDKNEQQIIYVDKEEDIDKPSDILEKLSLSPTAKQIDQKNETLDKIEQQLINVDKEEDVDKPSDILEKLSLLPTAEEIDQKNETLDKNGLEIIYVYKGVASEDKTLDAVPSKTVDLREESDKDNKNLHKGHSKDLEHAADVPGESLETMDTCDSQESTTLVIDETSDIAESRYANESQSKEDKDEAMDTAENKSERKQKDIDVKTTKPDQGENEMDVIIIEDKTDKSDKNVLENIENKEEEPDLADDAKDDDVIPIEQPPMPIIEIDDDDDDEIPPKKSPLKVTKQVEEKCMDVDEELPQQLSSNNKTAATMEISSTKKTDNRSNELLTVASEKTMDEVAKEEENNKKISDNEDTTNEVYYKKECINYECCHKHKQFFRVPQFAFSYFKVNKKKFKTQYICADCYDKALEMFEEYCGLINAKQPLLMENIPSGRQEFVEIIDSSDEEDGLESSKVVEPSKSAFSKNDLSLIERELHTTIKSVLERVEIQNQLTWSKTILVERLKRLEMETEYVDNELRSLQRKADKMHEGLYSCPKIKIRQLQPLDLNSGKIMGYETPHQEVQPIPPVGEIERPAIQTNGSYFAVKNNAIASWVPCKVVDQVEGGTTAQKNVKYYRIKFLKSQHQMLKTVPAKYMSYYEPPTVRLPIGTRVIAYFDATSLARGREKMNVQSAFYPGIIAEPLKPNNKFRYLIFYDDGYTQYVYHKDVRLVCHVSENVWEDVHPASRDFIQKYLTQYSINRPMVQTQKGQSMNTESNGYWLHARVVDIDCSLVLMQFEGSKSHTEWIYRGSLRLGPVFKEYQKTLQKSSNVPVSRLPRRTEPFIRYTEDEESSSQQQQAEKSNEGNRAVARKSFGRPESMMNAAQSSSNMQKEHSANIPAVKHLNNSTIYVEDENKPKGKVVYYTAKRNLPPRKYTPHMCSSGCLFVITHNLSAYSPLSKPLLSGWERFIFRQKIKKVVTYRAPCGKVFRNMKELHHYLRVTKNTLNVDNFDFSPDTNCLAEYVIESAIVQKRDISCGQEKMAIPLVNSYDSTLPPECKYSAKVIPTEGVHINKDPEFFAGCDCDDDCSDKSKCACWQLTVAGAKYGNPNTPIEEVGYQYKRLLEHVPTGIYECNPRCKCKQNCLNRVVQQSLQLKLQVFKTSNRGWGLRCINDVPRGTFVCVYAGHLLTEAKANEGGQDAGDEYFAELDYIEVAEQIKEGYESEVEPPEAEDEDAYQPELDDDDFTPSKSFLTRSKRQSATKSTRPGNQEDDSQERQVINFNPNADMNEDSVRESSIRNLYGKDEACYVMDAKISGNLGRYFNHSCAPNMFVQNVFVDTHDLRFPWVAFFSSSNIRAGSELTWNYNYEVGVVPGKVLYCQCGAPTCRLRLL